MDIRGQAAIVTGGGSGLGAACARMLADGGGKLAELVVASDPELNSAGAAADVAG